MWNLMLIGTSFFEKNVSLNLQLIAFVLMCFDTFNKFFFGNVEIFLLKESFMIELAFHKTMAVLCLFKENLVLQKKTMEDPLKYCSDETRGNG